jgi:competence protein ComEC
MLGENAGVAEEGRALYELPGSRCGADLCAVEIVRGGRRWRLLATRSPYLVPIQAMNRACAEADIVISERRLPWGCRPRWLKADRSLLAKTGGLTIAFTPPRLRAVKDPDDAWPWRRIVSRPAMSAPRNAVMGFRSRCPHRDAADRRKGFDTRSINRTGIPPQCIKSRVP